MTFDSILVSLPDTSQVIAQLGIFSRLPTEIRLLIWEHLFPDSRKSRTPHESHRISSLTPTKIAPVLCSSRFIYHEISSELYRNLDFKFKIHNSTSHLTWVKFQATSKKVHVTRVFLSAVMAQEYLSRFPFSRMTRPNFEIQIEGSELQRVTTIFEQWLKVNYIVEFLQRLSTPPYIHVRFVKSWLTEGVPRNDINYVKENETNFYHWTDYDFLILPFTRFVNWHYTLPATVRDAILNIPDTSPLRQAQSHLFKPVDVTGDNPSELKEVYTTLEILDKSQSCYMYEPRDALELEESVREASGIFQRIIKSIQDRYACLGRIPFVEDQSKDGDYSSQYYDAIYRFIWCLPFQAT